MSTRDIVDDLKAVQTLAPQALTATAHGTGVDLKGYNGAMLLVDAGAWTDGSHTPVLEESDDNSSFSAATAIQGSFTAITSAGQQNASQQVGYIGSKRYIRCSVTVSGATSGAIVGATVVKGAPINLPAT